MKAEYSIIKHFLIYDNWEKYHDDLTAKDFPEEIQLLYRTLDSFHQSNVGKTTLHIQDLANLFFASRPRDVDFYTGIFSTLENYTPNEDGILQLINSLQHSRLYRDLSLAAYNAAERRPGSDGILQHLMGRLSHIEEGAGKEISDTESTFVSDNLNELLDSTYNTSGLRWRLSALNRSLGSLRKGDFGFVFARPETGKTTFLSSEVSYMAQQAEGPVLWINNEEVNDKVKSRIYQAACGVTLEQLLSNPDKWDTEYKLLLAGKILMPKQASYSRRDIEKLCKRYRPSLIIFDQIDKITGFDADREDLLLGAIYQWARDLAKMYGPVIGVCQADGSGENTRWLTMGNVANAKTSKQAEADWILGIGAIHDTGWEQIRFLNISKNKLAGDKDTDPKLRHGKMEVLIQPEIARYKDMK